MNEFGEDTIFDYQGVMPAQFFPSRRGSTQVAPLRRLALAVLVDAVHVFQTDFNASSTRPRREFSEAREWLLGPPGDGPFSFENVCYLLAIDPSHLRNWLLQWQAMKRAGQPCRIVVRRSPVNRRRSLAARSSRAH